MNKTENQLEWFEIHLVLRVAPVLHNLYHPQTVFYRFEWFVFIMCVKLSSQLLEAVLNVTTLLVTLPCVPALL